MANRGVNKVILVGNLGADPDTRYMPNGGAVTTFSVATSEAWKDKQTGQQQERTEWHRVAIFGRLAEIAGEYLRKGSKVYLEGSLRTRKWQDQQTGQDRWSTDIVANEMQLLDSRSGGGQPSGADMYSQYESFQGSNDNMGGPVGVPPQAAAAPASSHSAPPTPPAGAAPVTGSSKSAPADDFDDDIPFYSGA